MMTTPTTTAEARNTTTYRITQTITAGYMLTALAMSFTHIADLFGLMGSDWQRWIAPLMIDTVAVIGKLSTGTAFTARTRKIGYRVLWIAGSVSFVANVTVGYVEHRYGNALLGAIVVIGALWAESHLHHLRPVTRKVTTPVPVAAPVKGKDPKRVEAARKAAATRAARKTTTTRAARKTTTAPQPLTFDTVIAEFDASAPPVDAPQWASVESRRYL
jgi:hypothetical protein